MHNAATASGFVFLTFVLAGASGCASDRRPLENGGTPRIQEAENHYFNLRLRDAQDAFREVLEDPVAPSDAKIEAARMLATIAWRFHHSPSEAEAWLVRAEELGPGNFGALSERVRLLEGTGATAAALEAAERARAAGTTLEESTVATTLFARIALGAIASAVELENVEPARQVAREALDRLNQLLEQQRGWLEPSRLALGLALRLDDGHSALAAWRSYHWIPDGGTNNSLLVDPAKTLDRELPNWSGPDSSARQRSAVVEALASSGFYDEAAWIAADPRARAADRAGAEGRAREIVAYSRFLADMRRAANDYYRRRAIGDAAHGELEREFRDRGRGLWDELPWPDEAPPFGSEALETELAKRFGVEIMWGRRSDAIAMHYGHRMLDDERLVKQYGRSASLRFVVLDAMLSNGYTTWFWDGRAATGGWVNDAGTIIQVREPYANDPLEAWVQLTYPADREQLEEEIAAKSATDDAIATANPYAYLPGMALRLRLRVFESLLDELAAQGLEGVALQSAFLAAVDASSRESSIFAHEGRHALDRSDIPAQWFRGDAEREFRAKLSEIAFAPEPRIALIGGILAANMGGDSSHGQANERVMRGFVSWMRENAAEIDGLDTARPLLPQLDLLTDDQLRQAARSMDPWA